MILFRWVRVLSCCNVSYDCQVNVGVKMLLWTSIQRWSRKTCCKWISWWWLRLWWMAPQISGTYFWTVKISTSSQHFINELSHFIGFCPYIILLLWVILILIFVPMSIRLWLPVNETVALNAMRRTIWVFGSVWICTKRHLLILFLPLLMSLSSWIQQTTW